MLSVVIPAYNESGMIDIAAKTIGGVLESENIAYELLFVDDGSKDNTWENIQKASENYENVRGVSFSRNFGKESAMMAGLANACGDCCVIIDCDLQHPPEKIVEMYRLWEQGYEVIEGVKSDRGEESALHRFSAKCFYSMISKATKIDMSRASDFKLMDRRAVDVLLNLREKDAFFRALSSWVGFETTQIEFEVQERTVGESKWSTWKLVKYAISNISSFSAAPMQIVTVLGVIMLIVACVFGVTAIVQKILGIALGGFTTIIIIQLFTGSIVMVSLGIIGYYIAKIYEEVKDRPRFIISDSCGKSDREIRTVG